MLGLVQKVKKWQQRQQKAELELISIHIPKTAGTSFRNTLKGIYGDEAVVRLDIELEVPVVKVNEERYHERQLPPWTRVAHGHFSLPLFHQQFGQFQKVPVITWLRDPVTRVISNYFYLAKRLAEELNEEEKGLNILLKMQRSLLEYARDPLSCNRMARFLEGMPLEDYLFVGIQEHYSEDLRRLARLLDWPGFEEYQYNQTGADYSQVSQEERDEIRVLNDEDVRLYERALELRAKHL